MKKTLRIMLALALVIAALTVSVSATGTNGFYDIGSANNVAITAYAGTNTTAITAKEADVDADDTAELYYEGSDRLGVTYSAAVNGANYGVILVEGSSLPTASSAIYYIDQVKANGTSIDFDVYPSDIAASKAAMKLYISSSAEGASLVEVPMAYAVNYVEPTEPEVTVLYGDVNGDTVVTTKDRLHIKRHFAKIAGYEEETLNKANSDVNNDGYVTTKDRLILVRYFAKITGYETLPKLD